MIDVLLQDLTHDGRVAAVRRCMTVELAKADVEAFVARAQVARSAMNTDEGSEHIDGTPGTNTSSNVDG